MKKILIFGPILPEWAEIQAIAESLQFLDSDYELTYVDPLDVSTLSIDHVEFIQNWKNKIQSLLHQYDAFFGFSLGGIILQQCFDLFEKKDKPLILFSVPSFSDELLTERLNQVVELIKHNQLAEAIAMKNKFVFHPYKFANPVVMPIYSVKAALRLSYGLELVLQIDSREKLKKTSTQFLHLIGKESQLVNLQNIFMPLISHLIEVPNAGMRVLKDNLSYCMHPILNFLNEKLS